MDTFTREDSRANATSERAMNDATRIDAVLPLRPVVFALLLMLRGEPLHGYGIMRRVNTHLGREALVGPGTLYRVLKELRGFGFIEHTGAPAANREVDARRQYYRLTKRGSAVVEAEARRIANLMHEADLGDLVASRPVR